MLRNFFKNRKQNKIHKLEIELAETKALQDGYNEVAMSNTRLPATFIVRMMKNDAKIAGLKKKLELLKGK